MVTLQGDGARCRTGHVINAQVYNDILTWQITEVRGHLALDNQKSVTTNKHHHGEAKVSPARILGLTDIL